MGLFAFTEEVGSTRTANEKGNLKVERLLHVSFQL